MRCGRNTRKTMTQARLPVTLSARDRCLASPSYSTPGTSPSQGEAGLGSGAHSIIAKISSANE